MITKVSLHKNGAGHIVHVYEIDKTKPACEIVGNSYVFNSTLVKSYTFMNTQQLLKQLEK